MGIGRALVLILSLTCLGPIGMKSAWAAPDFYSREFLETLNDICWFGASPVPRHSDKPWSRRLVRIDLENASAEDVFQVCVYDLTCGEVVFSGHIPRRSRQMIQVCSNSNFRGHILLLDIFGNLVERRGLRSPATVELGTLGTR